MAAAEKLGHMASSVTLAPAPSYLGSTSVPNEVLVLSFDPALFRTKLADLTSRTDIGDVLGPDCSPSQAVATKLITAEQVSALRAPAESWIMSPLKGSPVTHGVTRIQRPVDGMRPPSTRNRR